MDLLKKVELLLNAKTHAALPRHNRPNPLDDEEANLVAEVRRTLGEVEAKERELANRIKLERTEADAAAGRGDIENHLAHTRRLAELEYHLNNESTMAINLEEKLAALEEKLALAQAAVDHEAEKASQRSAAADEVLQPNEAAAPRRDDINLEKRKSRLSDD